MAKSLCVYVSYYTSCFHYLYFLFRSCSQLAHISCQSSVHSLVFPNIRSHREVTADRRYKETETLQEIGRNLPLSKSQVERSSQSSLLRLAINFIKARELMATAGLDSGELTTRDNFVGIFWLHCDMWILSTPRANTLNQDVRSGTDHL